MWSPGSPSIASIIRKGAIQAQIDAVEEEKERKKKEDEKKKKEEEEARMKAEDEKIVGSGSIVTNYIYRKNATGTLNESGTEIRVCTNLDSLSHNRCIKIWHPSFLHNFGYDKDKNISIYLKYSQTVQEYVKQCYIEDSIKVVMDDILPSSLCGTKDQFVIRYVPNPFRKFLKSALEFMFFLCRNCIVLGGLSIVKHMAVYNNELVFHSLTVSDDSETDVDKNFKLVADVFVEFFKIYPPNKDPIPLPLEIEDLIGSLRIFNFKQMHSDFLLYHFAVLEVNDRLDRIKSFHERTIYLVEKNGSVVNGGSALSYHLKALENMGGEYEIDGLVSNDWADLFKQERPNLGPMNDCYYFKYKYTHDGTNERKNKQLLRFARHSVTHLNDHVFQHSGEPFDRLKVDATVMQLLGQPLLAYHHLACASDLRNEFH